MNILVLLKMVPDIVEELEIAPDGKSLDLEAIRPIVSERDDHALEQALLLKEQGSAAPSRWWPSRAATSTRCCSPRWPRGPTGR